MTCNEVKCRLSSFQDNELDAAAKAAVQAHLDECGDCRREYRELEAVYRGIHKIKEIEPAQNFTSIVMGQIKQREERRWFALPSFVYSLIFIIFFFLGILFTANLKNGAPPEQEEMYVSNILIESQDLSLINIQDKTLAMLYSGGKTHEK